MAVLGVKKKVGQLRKIVWSGCGTDDVGSAAGSAPHMAVGELSLTPDSHPPSPVQTIPYATDYKKALLCHGLGLKPQGKVWKKIITQFSFATRLFMVGYSMSRQLVTKCETCVVQRFLHTRKKRIGRRKRKTKQKWRGYSITRGAWIRHQIPSRSICVSISPPIAQSRFQDEITPGQLISSGYDQSCAQETRVSKNSCRNLIFFVCVNWVCRKGDLINLHPLRRGWSTQ